MKFKLTFTAITAALLLAACGGGDSSAVKVVGDSLADSGTFGMKYTVQGNASNPTLIWTDRVAGALGAPSLCARYTANSAGAPVLNPAAASCTSYGVGGGRINPVGTAADATPMSVIQQLKDLAATGKFGDKEVLLANGGGNDAADLVGAYLAASKDGGASYTALLMELLSPSDIQDVRATCLGLPGMPHCMVPSPTQIQTAAAGLVQAGGFYMIVLANSFVDAINTYALNNGAQRVVVINAPDVTKTPRFQAVLAGVALASGGGTAGQTAAAEVAAMADGWVKVFNNQLSSRFADNPKVVIVDFYAELNKWLASPAAYGLTNTTTPACPITGKDNNGLPAYNIATCTADALSAAPPAGVNGGADWWKTYVFSDNFHGTPRTNQLVSDVVLTVLAAKGWK